MIIDLLNKTVQKLHKISVQEKHKKLDRHSTISTKDSH